MFPCVNLQPLPYVPKLFQPSVACPSCLHPNDETFNFCQRCGYKRKRMMTEPSPPLKKLKFSVNEDEIEQRISVLSKSRSDLPYARQKSSLEAELTAFLAQLNFPKDIPSCRPPEIIKFLVWKDKTGRTKVHNAQCSFLGHKGPSNCACAIRLAFGTVDSMIGKLRAIFSQNNRVGEWDPMLGIGNPASGLVIKQYLSSVRSEQLQARATPSQAKPLLLPHLEVLSKFVHVGLGEPCLTPPQIFIFARDQAFFKALFFSGDRASDLAQVKTSEILRLPDNSGFLFNHIWTKTLRNGDTNVFAFKRGSNKLVCPVAGIELYFKIAAAINIDISKGFLFRAITKEGKVSQQQFSATAAQARLKEYSQKLKAQWQDQHFTLHSFRGGAAVSLAMANVPLHEIMDHVGWKTSTQAMHYIRLREVLNPAGPAAKLADLDPASFAHFFQRNNLEGFTPAFPSRT